ncbi:MAG: hypothetical protein KA419_00580 [Acidobacteria bacterium]|nr:hypothetical protein [Acidobacteriota bacterium]
MQNTSMTTILLRLFLAAGALTLVVSYWGRESLPPVGDILPDLAAEPVQTPTDAAPFKVDRDGYTAELTPRFHYEFAGLVVSYYDSNAWHDMTHRDDPFNTKDLCVLWGRNVASDVFHRVKFSHGEFTCWCRWDSAELGSRFNLNQIANNHIIPANDAVSRVLEEIRTGDQVKVRGLLVDYRVRLPNGWGTRTTSTVRNDRGCEIIYADAVVVLRRGNLVFRALFDYSFYLVIGCLAVMAVRFVLSILGKR